jgi:Zn-dependent peptidase ImmA (M78 family)
MLSHNARTGADHARRAREALGLDLEDPIPDLLLAVEAIGAPVAVVPLAEGVAGAWMAGSIFVNLGEAAVRRRFTLAHELGHVRMDHSPVVDHASALTAFGGGAPEEVQANHFAAEFLVPRAAVLQRVEVPVTLMEVVRLACEFGVSAKMARIRMQTAELLRDETLIRRLDQEILDNEHRRLAEYLGYEPPEDSLSQLEQPRLPDRPSALAAHLAGEIGSTQFAAATGCSPAEARAMLRRFGLSI